MPSPPIQVFLTTIASQPALRQRQEYLLRTLHVKKIPFKSYDLASDENAKRLWKRKAPADKQQLPGLLVGGRFPGNFTDFEEAVEYDELATFLRLNESYDPSVEEDRPLLPTQAIGVPGAASPAQMTPEHHKPARFDSSPSGKPVNKREGEFDISTELSGFGLQGVKVTEDDLADLVKELGLQGDEAGDLVKGLSGGTTTPPATTAPLRQNKAKPDAPKSDDKKVVPEAGTAAEATGAQPEPTANKPETTEVSPKVDDAEAAPAASDSKQDPVKAVEQEGDKSEGGPESLANAEA
ncbi:hypothetical protein PLICRDRAFT_36022 [Plicaturopsis crispa FD-325 SS-3]|nr:hypothetical protein PLICRDRAFT_36022 [Plicaturopsis crispa FD-325 SS-3]